MSQSNTTPPTQETKTQADAAPNIPAPETKAAPAPSLAEEAAKAAPADAKTAEAKPAEQAKADTPPIPASADAYDLTLPQDSGLKNEKGEPFQFDKADPLASEVRKIFFDHKISQQAASELVGLYAKAMRDAASETQKVALAAEEAAIKAEITKLDMKSADGKAITGVQRINSVLAGVDAVLGSGASKDLIANIRDAAGLVRIEQLVAKAQEGASGKPTAGAGDKFAGLSGAALLAAIRENGAAKH